MLHNSEGRISIRLETGPKDKIKFVSAKIFSVNPKQNKS